MADVRIINPTHANPCTVRQMTDEEKARYGPPAPVPKRIQLMRAKAKANTEKGYADSWNDSICMDSFDKPKPIQAKQEAKPMKSNTKGNRIDRLRMHELFLEHGGSRAAAKKIAGELGCNWQTVLRAIKDEGWQNALDVEVTPTVITHTTPGDGPIPALSVNELTMDIVNDNGQAEKRTFKTKDELEKVFEPGAQPAVMVCPSLAETQGVATPQIPKWPFADDRILPVRGQEPDAAYYSVLDDLVAMYTNESDFRKSTTKAIAKEGLRGLRQLLAEKNDALWENLKSVNDPSGVELSSLLMQIANAAVQGLMFLDALEEW